MCDAGGVRLCIVYQHVVTWADVTAGPLAEKTPAQTHSLPSNVLLAPSPVSFCLCGLYISRSLTGEALCECNYRNL